MKQNTFDVGERVTYYPTRKTKDDNTHFEAEVIGHSKTGRPRIKFQALGIGEKKATVSKRALIRQGSLL